MAERTGESSGESKPVLAVPPDSLSESLASLGSSYSRRSKQPDEGGASLRPPSRFAKQAVGSPATAATTTAGAGVGESGAGPLAPSTGRKKSKKSKKPKGEKANVSDFTEGKDGPLKLSQPELAPDIVQDSDKVDREGKTTAAAGRFIEPAPVVSDLTMPTAFPPVLQPGQTLRQHNGPGAFAQRAGGEAQRRTRDGSDVSVYTAQPNYPAGMTTTGIGNTRETPSTGDAQVHPPTREYSQGTPSTLTPHDPVPIAAQVVNGPPNTIYEQDGIQERLPLGVMLRDRRICVILTLLVLICISLAAVLGVVLATNSSGNDNGIDGLENETGGGLRPTPAPVAFRFPTPLPTVRPTRVNQPIVDVLIANSFDGGAAINNVTTEQYWAMDYLLTQDPLLLTYSTDRLLQRYAFLIMFRIIDIRRGRHTSFWQYLNLTNNECFAEGIQCNTDGLMTVLDVRWKSVNGYLPEELGLFSMMGKSICYPQCVCVHKPDKSLCLCRYSHLFLSLSLSLFCSPFLDRP